MLVLLLVLELIETLWNVKESAPSNWMDILGINRNIVECKEGTYGCKWSGCWN